MSDSMDPKAAGQMPIAVVGVSALFPGSLDKTGFWRDILAGSDLIKDVPASHWLIEDYYDPDPKAPDMTYASRGAFLEDIDFDALSFGIPPTIAPATDTAQLLALIVANRVLQEATGGQFNDVDKEKVSVILGVTSAQELLGSMVSRLQKPIWVEGLRQAGIPEDEVQRACAKISEQFVPWQESTFPGLLGNVVAGRIANRLDLHGTNCVTDAACASAFSAVSMGVNELRLGQSDLVLTGGVDTMNDIFMYMCFSKTPALSRTGDCRPFSEKGDGTMLGEGIGMVALKRLADAERDGDNIYAVLKGVGSSSDGRSKSVYAPVPEGQARSLVRAYENAGYNADTVELVEAHGTGTVAGDAAEFQGLVQAFDDVGREDRQWCALGSVKSQIGHTKAAAGSAGLFKVVMALHNKVIPPTIKVDVPNPKMDLPASPFYLSGEARPWVRGSSHPRRASVSSFGFGGSNFHLTLEEYTGEHLAPRVRVTATELVLLSAASPAALIGAAKALAGEARADKRGEESGRGRLLPFLAWNTQRDFDASAPARLAVVAKDGAELAEKLIKAADAVSKSPDAAFSWPAGTSYSHGPAAGPVAFLFPGQGSQYLSMGSGVASTFDQAIGAWDQAADAQMGDVPLQEVVFPRRDFSAGAAEAQTERLTATQWAQPAIGVASLALLRVVDAIGVKPVAVAGHSFGEVTALHAAGVLSADDMLKVARRRGELMAEAAELPGSMVAVSATIEQLQPLLDEWKLDVVVANHNHPKQVVLSGTTDAVAAAEAKLKAAGLKGQRLKVATAFHSPVVSASTGPFAEFLADVDFGEASLPVYANSEAAPYPADAAGKRALLSGQIARPVRFVEQIDAMYAAGARVFLEVGPNSVLTGLVGRCLGDRPHTAINLDRKGRDGVTALWTALARLAAAGVAFDTSPLWEAWTPVEDPRTRPAPKMTITINGANYDKPYPPSGGASKRAAPNPPRVPEQVVVEKIVEKIVHVPVASPAAAPAAAPVAQPAAYAQPAQQTLQHAAPTYAPQAAPSGAWLNTFQELQRQTAEAFTAYERTMAETHMAFLSQAERTTQALTTMVTGQPIAAPQQYAAPQYAAPAPHYAPAPVAAPAPQYAAPAPQYAAPVVQQVAQPVAPAPVIPAPAPVVKAPVVIAAPVVAAAPSLDLHGLLMSVVAEKTGYPPEMLSDEMSLEADLGIDSIKRVEILSAMREEAPELPEVDASHMAQLQTLGQIVEYMAEAGGFDAAPAAPAAPAAAAAPVASGPSIDLHGLLMAVVAEKTGYPPEMLSDEMSLEADLGIDSIKRVEILSAMREEAPELPEVDASHMAQLQTLGQIVEYMADAGGFTIASEAPAATAAAPAASGPSIDLHGLLMSVVAEKTGYPPEMLSDEMSLEADLGIDSIKRVEILSAMREEAPELPEVDASHMAQLQTLGQIVEYMADAGGFDAAPAAASAAPAAPAAPAASGPSIDLHGLLMSVVAEKTGYPPEMLSDEMSLEADLGIDSIKRVEILSAMREEAPELPEVDASHMAQLQTLGQIVEYMAQNGGGEDPPAKGADAVPESGTVAIPSNLGRFALREVEAPALGMATAGLSTYGTLYITGGAVAAPLAAALTAAGVPAVSTDSLPADARAVVYVGGLREFADTDAALAVNREAFRLARQLAPNVNGDVSGDSAGGLFVTVQSTGGDFGLSGAEGEAAWSAGLSGLVKTAAQEWPAAQVKAVDVERGDRSDSAIAVLIASELMGGGPEIEVGLRADGRRTSFHSERVLANATGAVPLDASSVVVASGGARGVTAATLIALSRETRASFVLLGRTPLADEPSAVAGIDGDANLKRALLTAAKAAGTMPTPAALGGQVRGILAGREIRATLAAMAAAGSKARYVSVDVTDRAGLSAMLDTVRSEWGPISAVVHGAGVLADKLIAEKTDAQFDKVFDTKIEGLRALLAATASDPLKVICLFSSVAARSGNQGQCDYAMANEILNKVAGAEAARRPDCRVKSLGWGPWEGGMVTPALKARFEQLGVPLIPLDVGARMLVEDLKDPAEVELVLGGAPQKGALAAAGREPAVNLEVRVSRDSHPYLADHSIKGNPVVPVVLVLEWFVRAARACRSDLHLVAIRDLKVLRGVTLEDFDAVTTLSVRCRQISNGDGAQLSLELRRGDHPAPFYSASAEMSERPARTPKSVTSPKGLQAWDAAIYGDVLFHGPEFQVIRGLDGVSSEGMVATMSGTGDQGWTDDWRTDVAAMDGGLQLALLWAQKTLGGSSLPTGFSAFYPYQDGAMIGPLRCVLKRRSITGSKAVTDLVLEDAQGVPFAELRGVTTHLLPSASTETKAQPRA